MGVLAVLMGIGVGAVARLDTDERQALAQIKDAVQRARTFALSESAPARVVVDPQGAVVYGLGARRVGNWHFEAGLGAGWPVEATLVDAAPVREGVLGSAVTLGPGATLSIPPRSAFASPDGFALEAWLRPDEGVLPMTILEKHGSWRLGLDRDGVLEIELLLRSEGGEPELHRATYAGAALSAERWTRLSVAFDGYALVVAQDGYALGADTLFRPARRLEHVAGAPITSGDEEATRYRGAIDELRLASVVRGDHEPLPGGVVLEGEPQLVHVDARGHLDALHHRAPVRVSFTSGDPARRTLIEVGLLGHVRTWDEEVP